MAITRKFTATDMKTALRRAPTVNDLQTFVANNVAGEVKRIVETEKVLSTAPLSAGSFHISLSWG